MYKKDRKWTQCTKLHNIDMINNWTKLDNGYKWIEWIDFTINLQ